MNIVSNVGQNQSTAGGMGIVRQQDTPKTTGVNFPNLGSAQVAIGQMDIPKLLSPSAPNITHFPEPGGEITKLPSCCIDSMKNNV